MRRGRVGLDFKKDGVVCRIWSYDVDVCRGAKGN